MQTKQGVYTEPRRLQDLSTAEIAPLDALVDDKFPQMWYDIASTIYAALIDMLRPVLSCEDSAAISILLTMRIAAEIGGGMKYIPKGYNWDKRIQAQAIVAAFSGNNHTALAQTWGVTDSRIRQILDVERQRRINKYQQATAPRTAPKKQRSMRALKKMRHHQQQYEQFLAKQQNLPF